MLDENGEQRTSQEALDRWVMATAQSAIAYAAVLLRSRIAAEDVVHDCYCRLLCKTNIYDLPRDGRKLLFRSITNACINYKSRRPRDISLEAVSNNGAKRDVIDQVTADPMRVLLRKELETQVDEALARLPRKQCAALQLKILGHNLEEIAKALDTSVGNAGVLVHRARQAMVGYLASYLEEGTE